MSYNYSRGNEFIRVDHKLFRYLTTFFVPFALCLFVSLFILSMVFCNTSHATSPWKDEGPRPLRVLTIPVFSAPSTCSFADFEEPCSQTDQKCKTRKETCGDDVNELFENDFYGSMDGVDQMAIRQGRYAGNQGFDSFRSAEVEGDAVYFVGETKAGAARLNRKTNQQSGRWVERTAEKIHARGRMSDAEHKRFVASLAANQVLRSVTHVALSEPSVEGRHFKMTYAPIFPSEPVARNAQVRTYCRTAHPSIKAMAQGHRQYQTADQKAALATLEAECSGLVASNSNRTRARTASARTAGEVEVKSDYNRHNLHSFLEYLHKSYTYVDIAKKVSASSGTIGNIARNIGYAPTASYKDLWNSLKGKFKKQYASWQSDQ